MIRLDGIAKQHGKQILFAKSWHSARQNSKVSPRNWANSANHLKC